MRSILLLLVVFIASGFAPAAWRVTSASRPSGRAASTTAVAADDADATAAAASTDGAAPTPKMSVAALRAALEARGLATDGLKAVLAARLADYVASSVDLDAKPEEEAAAAGPATLAEYAELPPSLAASALKAGVRTLTPIQRAATCSLRLVWSASAMAVMPASPMLLQPSSSSTSAWFSRTLRAQPSIVQRHCCSSWPVPMLQRHMLACTRPCCTRLPTAASRLYQMPYAEKLGVCKMKRNSAFSAASHGRKTRRPLYRCYSHAYRHACWHAKKDMRTDMHIDIHCARHNRQSPRSRRSK